MSVGTEQRVADFYGVPSINVGKALADQIAAGTLTIEAAYKDGVHPADPGHASYAKSVTDFLASHESDKPAPVPPLGPALSPAPWETAGLADACELAAPGWTKSSASMSGHTPHMLTCNQPGAELTYDFNGTFVGIYWLASFDGGNVEWSIDGGAPGVVAARDRYTTSGSRVSYVFLADALSPGKHTLHLKIAEDSPPGSTALVHEAYLRLVDSRQKISWQSRAHFYGTAARIMQRILVQHARTRVALKRGGGQQRVPLEASESRSRTRLPGWLHSMMR